DVSVGRRNLGTFSTHSGIRPEARARPLGTPGPDTDGLAVRPYAHRDLMSPFPPSSPSASIAMLPARPQFPLVSCSDRCPAQEQFLPKQLVRQKIFRAQARSVKSVRKPGYAAKCFATVPEDRLSD